MLAGVTEVVNVVLTCSGAFEVVEVVVEFDNSTIGWLIVVLCAAGDVKLAALASGFDWSPASSRATASLRSSALSFQLSRLDMNLGGWKKDKNFDLSDDGDLPATDCFISPEAPKKAWLIESGPACCC